MKTATAVFRNVAGLVLVLALPLVYAAAPATSASPAAGLDVPSAAADGTVAGSGVATVRDDAATLPVEVSVSARKLAVEAALKALAPAVGRSSSPEALRTAFHAYYSYREAQPERVTRPYLYFVDLGLDNATARGYVFDMETLEVVEGAFHVAHGRGSSSTRNGVPTRFSNQPGSYASSLGLYLAQETYTFRGKSGGRTYSSVGLRMAGESGRFNSAARSRGIVAHGAPYVTAGGSGRSEGCPAMEQSRANRLLPMIANGGVVFIFSPRDTDWLANDPWVNAAE